MASSWLEVHDTPFCHGNIGLHSHKTALSIGVLSYTKSSYWVFLWPEFGGLVTSSNMLDIATCCSAFSAIFGHCNALARSADYCVYQQNKYQYRQLLADGLLSNQDMSNQTYAIHTFRQPITTFGLSHAVFIAKLETGRSSYTRVRFCTACAIDPASILPILVKLNVCAYTEYLWNLRCKTI